LTCNKEEHYLLVVTLFAKTCLWIRMKLNSNLSNKMLVSRTWKKNVIKKKHYKCNICFGMPIWHFQAWLRWRVSREATQRVVDSEILFWMSCNNIIQWNGIWLTSGRIPVVETIDAHFWGSDNSPN